jgi:hypothetical protein
LVEFAPYHVDDSKVENYLQGTNVDPRRSLLLARADGTIEGL